MTKLEAGKAFEQDFFSRIDASSTPEALADMYLLGRVMHWTHSQKINPDFLNWGEINERISTKWGLDSLEGLKKQSQERLQRYHLHASDQEFQAAVEATVRSIQT